jgi:N-acetylmuramic acid 6-phosphate (MurNAc-6-P) etherase
MKSENDNGEMPVKAEINQNVLKGSMRLQSGEAQELK